jgi:hypothetical protein
MNTYSNRYIKQFLAILALCALPLLALADEANDALKARINDVIQKAEQVSLSYKQLRTDVLAGDNEAVETDKQAVEAAEKNFRKAQQAARKQISAMHAKAAEGK